MLEIDVRLYGSFRDFSQNPLLRFELEPGSGLEHLRRELLARLRNLMPGADPEDLLARSVFADANEILTQDYRLTCSQVLSIIPPVCGG